MSGELFIQKSIYEAIRTELREWRKEGRSEETILVAVQNGHYPSGQVCIETYLSRLQEDMPEYYQILHQRFIEGKTAKQIPLFSQDTVYRKQQEAINLLASWIIQDEQLYRTTFHRERVLMQMSMMPPHHTQS